MAKKLHIRHVKSDVVNKAPTPGQLDFGELAINYNVGSPALYIKNSDSGITEFAYSALLPDVTSADNGKVLRVVDSEWLPDTASTIYAGTSEPSPSLGNNGEVYLQSSPAVVYETEGTTGLLGHNNSSVTNNWRLENLDLTPHKYIMCYFKSSVGVSDTGFTPPVIVTVQLDNAAVSTYGYIGSVMITLPFNRNRHYIVSCAVDTTKTKFQVIHQNTVWDISSSDANNNGRYLYKIEGYV